MKNINCYFIMFCHSVLAYPYRIYTVPEGALVKHTN
uniref:Uncharacterized protein n=1 Tax=Escherichia coli TaxID=562 RepID=A0A8F3ER38_ECOLX|nr:hypothetical protein p210446_2017_00023 [Escherichia coli]